MASTSSSIFKPDMLAENLQSLNSALKLTYTGAKKHLQNGISAIRDEVKDIYDLAESCITAMVLPVNNFLKDITQIDHEFHHELNKETPQLQVRVSAVTGIVPLEQALQSPMEENY